MKTFAVLFMLLLAQLSFGQTDTTKNVNAPITVKKLYPQGIAFSIGSNISGYQGFKLRASVLGGDKRVKYGFTMGYNHSGFADTTKDNKPQAVVNSLALGFDSRVYVENDFVYLAASGCYLMSVHDERFATTNGISMSLALGIAGFINKTNSSLFLEFGFIGQAFATQTKERPTSIGIMINAGLML